MGMPDFVLGHIVVPLNSVTVPISAIIAGIKILIKNNCILKEVFVIWQILAIKKQTNTI